MYKPNKTLLPHSDTRTFSADTFSLSVQPDGAALTAPFAAVALSAASATVLLAALVVDLLAALAGGTGGLSADHCTRSRAMRKAVQDEKVAARDAEPPCALIPTLTPLGALHSPCVIDYVCTTNSRRRTSRWWRRLSKRRSCVGGAVYAANCSLAINDMHYLHLPTSWRK